MIVEARRDTGGDKQRCSVWRLYQQSGTRMSESFPLISSAELRWSRMIEGQDEDHVLCLKENLPPSLHLQLDLHRYRGHGVPATGRLIDCIACPSHHTTNTYLPCTLAPFLLAAGWPSSVISTCSSTHPSSWIPSAPSLSLYDDRCIGFLIINQPRQTMTSIKPLTAALFCSLLYFCGVHFYLLLLLLRTYTIYTSSSQSPQYMV